MHLLNDVVTLIPTNNGTMVTTAHPSTLNGVTASVNGVPTSLGIPTNLNCMAPPFHSAQAINAINGLLRANGSFQAPLNGVQTTGLNVNVNGYQNGIPLATVNSMSTSPLSNVTGSSSNGVTTPTTPAPLSPSASMELVWHGEFDRLFAQYFPHLWCLVPTFYPPTDRWRTFKDSAKVRFSCQECGHGWTSMKGRVVFWFELNFGTNSGCVMFKLYGQQCQKCKNGRFEHAMWYPEEVVKVLGNVYNRVGQIYYGFVRPPLRIDRRVGKPRNQHNAELCQACKEGLCKEEWSFT